MVETLECQMAVHLASKLVERKESQMGYLSVGHLVMYLVWTTAEHLACSLAEYSATRMDSLMAGRSA